MPAKKQRSERKAKPSGQVVGRSLDPIVRQIPSPMFGDPVSPWHYWFAWHPIVTWDSRFVWLRKVQRRLIQKHQHLSHGGDDQWWQYHFESGYLPNHAISRDGGKEEP